MKDPSLWVSEMESHNLEQHEKDRKERGFSNYDWWNFNDYLAWIIIQGCKKFKEEGHGYPADLSWDEWVEVLDQIIDGFEAHFEYSRSEDMPHGRDQIRVWIESKMSRINNALNLFSKYFESMWD